MKFNKFSFQPSKLISVKNEIKKTFPTKADIYKIKSKKAKEIDLEELLKKIREFSLDKIIYLADSLKTEEIIALAINYSNIPNELYQKVNKILIYKNEKFLIKFLWQNFIDDYNNNDLISLIGNLLASFSKLNEHYSLLDTIFRDSSPLINIRKEIENNKRPLFDFLEKLDLIFENKISKRLAADLFSKNSKPFFIREDNDNLIKIFKELEIKDFKAVVENYLFVFKDNEYIEELMYTIKDRLGDPREEYSTAWDSIDHKAKEKAIGWFNLQVLKEFINNIDVNEKEAKERFNYWYKYRNKAKPMFFIKKYKQLFLVFEKFAVVEFGNKGNAAYFYGINFFNEKLRKFMDEKNSQNNNHLKFYPKARNKNIKNVERFRHIDGWQNTADKLVDDFKSGRR